MASNPVQCVKSYSGKKAKLQLENVQFQFQSAQKSRQCKVEIQFFRPGVARIPALLFQLRSRFYIIYVRLKPNMSIRLQCNGILLRKHFTFKVGFSCWIFYRHRIESIDHHSQSHSWSRETNRRFHRVSKKKVYSKVNSWSRNTEDITF